MTEVSGSRWLRIIPLVFVTYSLAYFDRVNFGFGSAAGLGTDLRLTPGQSALLSALFFLGYFAFQVPGTVYAERRSVRPLIFWCTLFWGLLASLTGLVTGFKALLIIRFLLGVAEASVLPALLVYLNLWFTKSERARANTFLILGNPITVMWMSVVSGYLVQAFNWRGMFVIEGIPAIVWAFAWRALAPDEPAQAAWLDPNDRRILAAVLAREQAAIQPVHNYRAAFASKAVLHLGAIFFCWSLGLYGFILWLPSILKQISAYGIVGTGWLSALPFLIVIPGMLILSQASDRSSNRQRFVWPSLMLGGLAFFFAYFVGDSRFGLTYFLLIVAAAGLYAPYGPFFAVMPELMPRNVAGGATALINSFGALGGFAGIYLVGYCNAITGNPRNSYLLMSGALFAAGLLVAGFRPLLEAPPMARSSLR
jgi:sugar phosphate permease